MTPDQIKDAKAIERGLKRIAKILERNHWDLIADMDGLTLHDGTTTRQWSGINWRDDVNPDGNIVRVGSGHFTYGH